MVMSRRECGILGSIKSRQKLQDKYQGYIDTYNSNPVLCKNCGKTIPYKKRYNCFCNRSCSATYYNYHRFRRHNSKSIKQCLNCGKDYHDRKTKKYYCSHECCKIHKWELKKISIEESGEFTKTTKTCKKYLIDKYGYKCSMCGISEWGGRPILLILDHIDGNSDNRKIDNLRLICSNCDTLTPTYKSKNFGNGRHSRRIRYRNGQSY